MDNSSACSHGVAGHSASARACNGNTEDVWNKRGATRIAVTRIERNKGNTKQKRSLYDVVKLEEQLMAFFGTRMPGSRWRPRLTYWIAWRQLWKRSKGQLKPNRANQCELRYKVCMHAIIARKRCRWPLAAGDLSIWGLAGIQVTYYTDELPVSTGARPSSRVKKSESWVSVLKSCMPQSNPSLRLQIFNLTDLQINLYLMCLYFY